MVKKTYDDGRVASLTVVFFKKFLIRFKFI